jgi:hypothetical protein
MLRADCLEREKMFLAVKSLTSAVGGMGCFTGWVERRRVFLRDWSRLEYGLVNQRYRTQIHNPNR